ncbi:RNA polymerase sigma factor [Echinicola vietnamensis]|uniref:RNA polymerase sigma factor, sigma-70 family n=1 Tax=Echinicola vietnamensis (strain DSM 17526 / LMG 23754 / KMM 6221) TaxID=926556 RepID=L0G1D4_ECHVK|nr:sigma-70 family RNA polymerase sigma factor [Echinicola vietnamensis]AGA78826.1 RNA polymerase sigma factor, sigma-70 family [Echinicola vietnamensis DSM 17526]
MVPHHPDIELLESIRNDDLRAFDQLYHQYWEVMYQAAVGRLKSQDLAQDVVQDIFIDFWNRRKSLDINVSLKAYLLTAVKYKVFRKVDKLNRHEQLSASHLEELSASASFMEFEEIFDLIEVKLEQLAPMHHKIFRMNKMEGVSVREISEQVNMAPQSVHNVLSKTTKYLKKELKGYYFL